jgi:hypothetical protein
MKRPFLWAILAISVWGCAPTVQPFSECFYIYEQQREAGVSQQDAFENYTECREAEHD